MSKEGRIALLVNIICCVAVLFISVGYSSFSKKLTMDEIAATVRVEKEIRVNKIVLSGTSNGAVSSWEDYNHDSIEGGIVLPSETSEIIYTVDILNLSEKEYGILSLTGLSEELDYELLDYHLEDKICVESKCTLGVTRPIKIKIKYKTGKYNASKTEYNFKLNFDFKTYHKINYVDIPSTDLPMEIIDGGVFSQMIAPKVSKGIKIKSGEQVLTEGVDYTYNDNKLIINTTTDDITITNLKYQVGDYVKLKTEGFYVISTDESADTLTMLAEWNLNVGNKTVSGTLGMQNSACKGYLDGQNESDWKCTIPYSSTNYWGSVTKYPAWVYNENSNLYTHVNNYVAELKKAGYNTAVGRLIKYEELITLGCVVEGENGSCSSAPSWIKNTTFWAGSAVKTEYMWTINTYNSVGIGRYYVSNNTGARPVITINTSEI